MEAAKLINEVVAALNIAKTLDSEITERESDIDNVNSLEEKISANISEGNRDEAEINLAQLDEIAQASYHNESALETEEELTNKKLKEKENSYNKARDRVTELLNREYELTETINKLETKKATTRKKSEKEDIESQIQALSIDVEDTKYDLENAKSKEKVTKKELNEVKNQVETTKSILADLNNSNSSTASTSENGKLQIESDIHYFEKEGLIGIYPTDTDLTASNTSNTDVYNIEEHKDEYKIIDESGEIIDYNTQYGVVLANIDNIENQVEKSKLITKLNEEWISSIDEEIDIRKNQLKTETSEANKTDFKSRIKSLEVLKTEKQREINENILLAENNISSSNVNSNDNVVNNEEVEIINADGTVIDYDTKYTEKLNSFTGEDTYETYSKKSEIYNNWVSATTQEILLKKIELAEANDEEKNDIENEIAILNNNILDQKEYAALYKAQAESMKTSELVTDNSVVVDEPIVDNTVVDETTVDNTVVDETIVDNTVADEPIVDNTVVDEPIVDNTVVDEPIVDNTLVDESTLNHIDLTQFDKNVVNADGSVADYSSEYEKKIEQTSSLDSEYSINIEKAKLTTELINNINEEIKYRNEELNYATEENVKEEITIKINELEAKKIEKQSSYNQYQTLASNEKLKEEEANLTANNLNAPEDEFSNLKYNNKFKYKSTQSQKILQTVPESKNQARQMEEEAEVLLNSASRESSQEEKYNIIEKANALTDKSKDIQNEIAKLYENANRNEFYNNQAVISKIKTDNNDPFADDVLMTELFIEEADSYFDEAKNKREKAANNPNYKAKETSLQEAYELEMKAIEKQKKAINILAKDNTEELYAVVDNENNTAVNEVITNNTNTTEKIANNNSSNYNKPVATNNKITTEDQEVILNLNPEEINEIKKSENYVAYAELKKENRRLVKEAEVEYVESEKFQQEADDQKQLGVSLRAMMEGSSSEEDKAKKLKQLEKLSGMIADNETKSTELKQSADNKQLQAKELSDKSDYILINAEEEESKRITAIEKAEIFDSEFMSEVMNRSTEPIVDNAVVDEPIVDNTLVDEPIVDNTIVDESIVDNTIVDEPIVDNAVVDEPIVDNTVVDEPIVDNAVVDEPIVDNTVVDEPIIDNTVVDEPIIDNTSVIERTNSTPSNIDEIPAVLNKSIFVMNNNQAAYSENNRIPISPKLPEGLVFKVQIGAFRNPIPQNHFKGFAPIMAEDAGNGITRYTAGLFKTFNMANEAKKSIRSIGYSDAFVVAFMNGERININEARSMLDGSVADEGSFTVNSNNERNTTESNTSSESNVPVVTEEVVDGVSTDVRNIEGVFYAIQVGVYSKPVTASQLNNVNPLNSERTASGLIRYTSGVYKTLEDANAAKERIKALGISDAFIVAYNGGTKITVANATDLLNTGTSTNNSIDETPVVEDPIDETPVVEDPIDETPVVEDSIDETPVVEDPIDETPIIEDPIDETPIIEDPIDETPVVEDPIDETPVNNIVGYEPKEDLNLEFKVKLGEYEEDVPVEDAGLFLQLTGRGVKNYEKSNKTVYTIGSFPDYESALDLQIEMKELGISKPETIVFKDGVELKLEEALELMKNNQ
jgi:hypothetical protein